jgi:outer membrane protein TolC
LILGASPAADWRTSFGARDLDGLVSESVAHYHRLAAAKASVEEAREYLPTATTLDALEALLPWNVKAILEERRKCTEAALCSATAT